VSDLADRMERDILDCQRNCTYMKEGYDKRGNMVHYCTYHFPESRRDPITCKYKGGMIDIDKLINFVTIAYYKCHNARRPRK